MEQPYSWVCGLWVFAVVGMLPGASYLIPRFIKKAAQWSSPTVWRKCDYDIPSVKAVEPL